MSPSDSPVLHPARIDSPAASGASLTTRLPQTLVGTVELRSHATQVSWDVQGHNVCLLQVFYATMMAALAVYSDLVAERLAVQGKVAAGHGPHGGHTGAAASVSRRQGRG